MLWRVDLSTTGNVVPDGDSLRITMCPASSTESVSSSSAAFAATLTANTIESVSAPIGSRTMLPGVKTNTTGFAPRSPSTR